MSLSQLPLVCLLSVAFGATGWLVSIKVEPPIRTPYVGSDACEGCHAAIHAQWEDSLHRKMMRPVTERGALVVDLDATEHAVGFDPADVVWVIGSKWEQQFMGHDGSGETLLPGVFRRISRDFDPVGFDGWQVPVPKQRCHGCHTVGLDPETGEFLEAGIGCESCHGPGARHVETFGFAPIYSSADAQVCGQCHVRGKSTSSEHFFPVDYRPGDDLLAKVEELVPLPGQNTSQWWGNGAERQRHQEFTAWRHSSHARSLESLRASYDGRFGEVSEACLSCHSGDYILGGRRKPSVDEAQLGITCAVCHQTHGELETPRAACSDCHTSGPFHHEPSPESGRPHVPCPEEARVDCVACHMPQVVKSGGGYPLHSHAGGVVPPADGERYGMPTSCSNGGCHSDRDAPWLEAAFADHYGASRAPNERKLP